jgi:hypothetical protein
MYISILMIFWEFPGDMYIKQKQESEDFFDFTFWNSKQYASLIHSFLYILVGSQWLFYAEVELFMVLNKTINI